MPEIAKHIEVVFDDKGAQRLLVDGEEFPWYITEAGATITTPRVGTDLPTATITLIADKVAVRDQRSQGDGAESRSLEAVLDAVRAVAIEARPSTTARGYGHKHQKLRKREARKVKAGEAYCWRCLKEGKPRERAWIAPDEPWDLGHDDKDRSVYRGPEHRDCNRRTSSRRTFVTRKRPKGEAHPGLID